MINQLLTQHLPHNMTDKYKDMLRYFNASVVLDSAYQLFTNDYTGELMKIKDKNFMVINSVDEKKMFRLQVEYIRRILHNEKSIYLKGTHDDMFMKPDSEVVNKVLSFLSND